MNREISKRLAILEVAAKAIEKEKRLHDPFVLYSPWSILGDEFFLEYYPEGLFQKPQRTDAITYQEAVKRIFEYPGKMLCQISLGECEEWLFAFHYYSNHAQIYTQEQRERRFRADLERNPKLSELLPESGTAIVETMLKLPQTFTVSMGVLQYAIATTR